MSEQAPEGQNNEAYSSQIDPAFSRAWNEVFAEEDSKAAGEGAESSPADGAAEATPATPVEPAGQQPAKAAGAEGGEKPADAPTPADAGPVPAGEGATDGAPAGSTPSVSAGTGTTPYATVAPLFDTASSQLLANSEAALREQAIEDVREDLDPSIIDAINAHPLQLVNETVPSIRDGEGPITLRTSAEAKEWQDAVKHIISNQVGARTTALLTDAQPILSVLQDSVSIFRTNKDLVPGTAEYNPELARRLVTMAGAYLYKDEDGKALGFRVDVQPLIDSIREELKTAAPAPATTQRQAQAAAQARTPEGKFDAPQAGIPSQAGISGDPEEDFTAFWNTVKMPNMNI